MSIEAKTIAPAPTPQERVSSLFESKINRRDFLLKGAVASTIIPAFIFGRNIVQTQDEINSLKKDPIYHTAPTVEDGIDSQLTNLETDKQENYKRLLIAVPGAAVAVFLASENLKNSLPTPTAKSPLDSSE